VALSSRKTSVEIDVELYEAARRILDTSGVRETVEEAFSEVIGRAARRDEVEALAGRRGLDLANPKAMAGSWRR
jgi:Arc/MetJ family transcription regulator